MRLIFITTDLAKDGHTLFNSELSTDLNRIGTMFVFQGSLTKGLRLRLLTIITILGLGKC